MNVFRAITWRLLPLVLVYLSAGCSLLTIKSPEIPLSPRDMETRQLTRDYAAHFSTTLTRLIDDTATAANDADIRRQALRLKLGLVGEVTRASTGLSPTVSLLDTWAFSFQVRDFLTSGAGAHLLGSGQSTVSDSAVHLANEADTMAHGVAGDDYTRYRRFVDDYARRNPLSDTDMARPSVLAAWVGVEHENNPLRAVGTVSQALGDVSDRVRIYGERAPNLGMWQAELALDRAGFDNASYRTALHTVDGQLERISKLADTSPELVHEAIAEVRDSLKVSTDRLDTSWTQTLQTLHGEREALAIDLAAERDALTTTFDVQRARITADVAKITADAVDTSWRELRTLIREALLLTIVLALVMLGLPFAAGFYVGRRRNP